VDEIPEAMEAAVVTQSESLPEDSDTNPKSPMDVLLPYPWTLHNPRFSEVARRSSNGSAPGDSVAWDRCC
jgi:hypothetical protein